MRIYRLLSVGINHDPVPTLALRHPITGCTKVKNLSHSQRLPRNRYDHIILLQYMSGRSVEQPQHISVR